MALLHSSNSSHSSKKTRAGVRRVDGMNQVTFEALWRATLSRMRERDPVVDEGNTPAQRPGPVRKTGKRC